MAAIGFHQLKNALASSARRLTLSWPKMECHSM
jgi:hypothetical protein